MAAMVIVNNPGDWGYVYAPLVHADSTIFTPLASATNASLLFALANLAVLYALLAWLHSRRLYWRI